MRVLTNVHQRDAGPGVLVDAAAASGHQHVEWQPTEAPAPELDGFGAAMTFGGAMHADQEADHPWLATEKELLRDLLRRRTPVLGVCLGAQLLAEAAGSEPRRAGTPEIGWYEVSLTEDAADDPVAAVLPPRFEAFQWHSYEAPLPPGATALATSDVCLQAYRLDGNSWGIQFHAEVTGEIVGSWLDDYGKDEDAVRMGVDPDAIREQTRPRIHEWNELGRALCGRFLETATRE